MRGASEARRLDDFAGILRLSPAAHLRAFSRVAAISLVSLVFWIRLELGGPLSRALGENGRARRAAAGKRWAAWMAALLGMKREVRGQPAGSPCLIVSNHLGYMDVITLLSNAGAIFVAKSEVARWPVAGALARAGGAIFIERGSAKGLLAAAREVESALRDGCRVVVFPEGTSSEGRTVLPFGAAMLEAARRAKAPVFTAAIGYATPPGSPSAREAICWWGEMTFFDHLYRLLSLPSFEARLTLGERPVAGRDRGEIAARARQEILSSFEPIG